MKNFNSFIKDYSTRDFIYFLRKSPFPYLINKSNYQQRIYGAVKCIYFNAILHRFIHKEVDVMLLADINDMVYLSIMNANDYKKIFHIVLNRYIFGTRV